MMNPSNIGCQLLYTNFRKLEGIGIFRLALLYHGFKELKVIKNPNGDFLLKVSGMYEENQYIDNKVFALYTGTETAEEREIIRNIYNNDFTKLPQTIQRELKRVYPSNTDGNLYGEMIQLLMITASGAEGIDLKNVRFVHIMEPYWHHVRINQVIGRARRICSHAGLPEELQTVKVFMYISILPDEVLESDEYVDLNHKDDNTTTDESLYFIMDRKHKLFQMFLDTLKEVSIDCIVNHNKCYHFPNKSVSDNRLITDIDYTQSATGETQLKPSEPDKTVQHKLIVKKFSINGKEKPYVLDENDKIVYDFLQYYKTKDSENKILVRVGKLDSSGELKLD